MKILNLKMTKVAYAINLCMIILIASCNPYINLSDHENKATKVGLLLPYGSKIRGDEALAISLENAARLAAHDLGYRKIHLMVYATESKPKIAAKAAKKAVNDGADIIIGPLRSDVANSAAVAIVDKNINVLTFSNNTEISGRNLFLLGTSFETLAYRLTAYAYKNNSRNWLLIHPETKEGEVAKNAIVKAAQKNGILLQGTLSFELTTEGIVETIPKIAELVETLNVDTIMLTSNSAGALPLLGQLLPEKGVDPKIIRYIGLARWDVSKQTLKLPGLQNGWFALPDPILAKQFNTRYQTIFNQTPHPLASLAYDGVAVVGALQKERKNMSSKSLRTSSGFLGVNGLFRFTKKGTNERSLSIATIRKNEITIIDPSSTSFKP